MSAECSICLSALKEPVSIPCGHIYCTKCLSDHVNAPNNEALQSTCPTCRVKFNIVTPDLTYLPKKYHQYVLSSVRRVYFDTTRQADLRAELSTAKAKIKKLEKDEETLLRECERHMGSAAAHAKGEREARAEVDTLRQLLKQNDADHTVGRIEMRRAHNELHRRYVDLKSLQSNLKHKQIQADMSIASSSASQRPQSKPNTPIADISIPPGPNHGYKARADMSRSSYWAAWLNSEAADESMSAGPSTAVDASGGIPAPASARVIRKMPARKGRPRPSSPPPVFVPSNKRPRVSNPS
ncbi:hypothetical protein FPV67DRAFT_1476183 [Lyophyllum atratum]|nr:hypothetical protein FPV67DRAFT_1476183 [Lyophyllum atratum]